MSNRAIDDEVKIQILSYISIGLKVPKVTFIIQISESQSYKLKKKAIERGREATQTFPILFSYVQDAPRPSRPTICTFESMNGLNAYIESNDDGANHQSLEELSFSVGISAMTIQRILERLSFKNLKITTKP